MGGCFDGGMVGGVVDISSLASRLAANFGRRAGALVEADHPRAAEPPIFFQSVVASSIETMLVESINKRRGERHVRCAISVLR
jgi:hypothetical protein